MFTAHDLADAMGVSHEVGKRSVVALIWNGICEESGDGVDVGEGFEPIIHYIPLPPGPREHWTDVPPEIAQVRIMGGDPLRVERGYPVRIRTERQQRQNMSTPGARQVIKQQNRAFEAQEEAKAKRKAEQAAKAAKALAEGKPKWKR